MLQLTTLERNAGVVGMLPSMARTSVVIDVVVAAAAATAAI